MENSKKNVSDFEQIKLYYQNKKQNKNNINHNKTIQLSVLIKPVCFIIFAILIEILNFRLVNWSWNNILPTNFAMEFGIILLLAGILALITNRKAQSITMYTFISLMVILSIVNLTLFNKQGIVFNFSMLTLLGEARKAFNSSFLDIKSILFLLIQLVLIICCQVQIDKLCDKEIEIKKNFKYIIPIAVCVLFSSVGSISYTTNKNSLCEYDQDLYTYQTSTQGFFQKFGTFSILTQPLSKPIEEFSQEKAIATLEENEVPSNESALLYGDNLIMIMLESYDTFAIDPYNTPNLYRLTQEGIYETNYYSNNKTNISEFISLNGYVPNLNAVILDSNNDLAVKYSLPNMFKELGYTANYFHSYDGNFYNRNQLNIQIGFEDVIDCADSGLITPQWDYWNLEQDYLDKVITKLAPNDGSKFMSFYLTVSTHGTYEYELDNFKEYQDIYLSNLDAYKDYLTSIGYNYPTEENLATYLMHFKSRAIETDFMIGKLINYLEETGLIENTSLVLFGDHNAYYNSLSPTIKLNENSTAVDVYNVPLIFYSKKLGARKLTEFSTVTDIYSTISGLYGLKSNNAFKQGNNLLDNSKHNNFMFAKYSGYYNDKFYGINLDSIIPLRKTDNLTEQDYQQFKEKIEAFNKQQIFIAEILNNKLKA